MFTPTPNTGEKIVSCKVDLSPFVPLNTEANPTLKNKFLLSFVNPNLGTIPKEPRIVSSPFVKGKIIASAFTSNLFKLNGDEKYEKNETPKDPDDNQKDK